LLSVFLTFSSSGDLSPLDFPISGSTLSDSCRILQELLPALFASPGLWSTTGSTAGRGLWASEVFILALLYYSWPLEGSVLQSVKVSIFHP
jgi:hypothetical protein